ncbi:MAG: 6-bladed beta-propeller, partial [Gemmatimonadota bacterium]
MDSTLGILFFTPATLAGAMLGRRRRVCLTCTALLSLACSEAPVRDTGTWVAEIDTVGDTVVVRTISGSVWGETATLVEDLVIGMLEGPEELVFGHVAAIAVDERGGMYVLDISVPAIRHFDAEGRYVRTFGREGSGPGEYRNRVNGLAVRPDGRVVVLDLDNQRITVFEPDGTPWAHWRISNNAFWRQPLTVDHAGHTYMRVFTSLEQEIDPYLRVGWLHLDREGEIVDTVAPPRIEGEAAMHEPTG